MTEAGQRVLEGALTAESAGAMLYRRPLSPSGVVTLNEEPVILNEVKDIRAGWGFNTSHPPRDPSPNAQDDKLMDGS
jgi:hypothetical protein